MAVLFLVVLLACDRMAPWPVQDDSVPEDERIAVSPALLDFGALSVNLIGDATRTLTIYNLGDTDVTVTGHDEPLGDDEVFRVESQPVLVIAGGESLDVEVSFVPSTDEDYLARLRFEPGSELVELRGSGTAPVLRTEDAEISPTVLGCTGDGTVIVENRGSEALIVDPSSSGDEFALVGWTRDVAPGASMEIGVAFTPSGGGSRSGLLSVATNDPARPVATVELSGLGYEGERVTERFVYAPAAPTDVIFAVEGGLYAGDERVEPAVEAYATQMHDAGIELNATSVSSAGACEGPAPRYSEPGDSALRLEAVLMHGFEGAGGGFDGDLVGLIADVLLESDPGGCLADFRREDASLDIVIIAESAPVDDPLPDFTALVEGLPDGTRVRVGVLVPSGPECGSGGEAYAALAERFNGAIGDNCAGAWEAGFTAFAALPTVTREVRYPLAELPVPSTLALSADGAPATGWSWDAGSNELVIDAETHPDVGAELSVTYVSAVSCSP